MSEDLNHLKKSNPFFYNFYVNKKFLLIPTILFLIIFNIYNFFSPKLYDVKLNAKVIDIYKFIKLNSFVDKNEILYQINSANLANQIADSFTDYEEIEEAVKKYSKINNNPKLEKNQKKELVMKLTQSFSLDTLNEENVKRIEKSMIKIDNSKKLLKLIIVNLLIILIGILLGLSIILFRNKKDIFK